MNWKKLLLVGVGWGIGTAVGLAGIVGVYLWHQSRPKPPKTWNTSAIFSSDDGPGFGVDGNGQQKSIYLTYALRNSTDADYEIGPDTEIRIMMRNSDGSLSEPLPKEIAVLRRPIFVPAKQEAFSRLSIVFGNSIPPKSVTETDDQYHEKLRAFCREQFRGASFVLFDDANRYEIILPAIRKEKPPQKPS